MQIPWIDRILPIVIDRHSRDEHGAYRVTLSFGRIAHENKMDKNAIDLQLQQKNMDWLEFLYRYATSLGIDPKQEPEAVAAVDAQSSAERARNVRFIAMKLVETLNRPATSQA